MKQGYRKGYSYYPQLDSIRGLSFLGIFIYHAVHPEFDSSFPAKLAGYLYHQLPLAIDVFFILSSFLLTRIGLEEYEKKGNFSFLNYFTRRALRIWPLYYLIMVSSFLIFPLIARQAGLIMSLPEPWYYLFFVSNYYYVDHVFFLRILWTLSVEEQFYLLLGISLRFFRKKLNLIFYFFIAASILFTLYSYFSEVETYFHTLTYFIDFAIGGLFALYCHRNDNKVVWLSRLKKGGMLLFYLYLPVHFLIFFLIDSLGAGSPGHIINRYLFIIYLSLLISEQLLNPRRIRLLEKNRFLIYTGKISYGLYCFHGMAITGFDVLKEKFHWQISQYILAFLILGVNFLIAGTSYAFFEKPFLRLKDKLRRA